MKNKLIYNLYLDESGTNNLYSYEDYINNVGLESHCTLLGAIYHKPIIDSVLIPQVKKLKKKLWKTTEVIIHSVDLRHKKGPFAIFGVDESLYKTFKDEMLEILKSTQPTLICVSLDKKEWVNIYPRKYFFGDDPFDQIFPWFLERFADFLNKIPCDDTTEVVGKIIAESRDSKLDRSLQEVLTSTLNYGTQYKNATHFEKINGTIEFKKKNFNIIPLQMADYYCYPFYKKHKLSDSENKLFSHLRDYIYDHDFRSYGLKFYP